MLINNNLVHEDETLDDLEYNGLYIIQKKNSFRFGMDPVLLSDFVKLKNGQKIADFGSGTGIISILLSQKARDLCIYAFEIQEKMTDMLARSIELNNIDSVKIINDDFTSLFKNFNNFFDVIVSNPPYGKNKRDIKNNDPSINAARREEGFELEDFLSSVSKCLKYGGKFYICYPINRFIELISSMQRFNLTPKRLRFVHSKSNSSPYLFLLMASKYGKDYLNIEPPLFIRDDSGDYTDEVYRIYHKKREA